MFVQIKVSEDELKEFQQPLSKEDIMRILPMTVAALAAITPLPAVAQDSELSGAAEVLNDPATQQVAAVTLSTLLEALLDIPVAPLVEAMAKVDPDISDEVDQDATLRELAGTDADDMPAMVREELPQAMTMMGDMAEGLEAMLPALREMAEQIEQSVEQARVNS